MAEDAKIDELYQLPLDEFTKARNALAKTLTGDRKRIVASLPKPAIPAWAINQLYWNERGTYKALIDAAEKLRAAHRAVLGGKKVDLRKPDEVHRAALERAVGSTLVLLEKKSGRASDAARDTIRRTLAALPTEEQPGRLTREPEAAGFSLFAGVKPRAIEPPREAPSRPGKPPAKQEDSRTAHDREREQEQERKRAERERQEAEKARALALKQAQQEHRQAQQAVERSAFLTKKAESQLREARAAEEKAASQLKDAERRLADIEAGRV